jgi:CheY-like chemotaxis protein
MPGVRVIHWRATESGPLLDACRKSGLPVDYRDGDGGAVCRAVRANVPDVVVIDLARLPSHGREVAIWLRGRKSTRGVPIVFVGGEERKVAAIRELLPDAAYCGLGEVTSFVKRLLKAPRQADPVKPTGIMERARGKSAIQKLGISPGSVVCVAEPPRNFPALLGDLPESVEFLEAPAPITLWFVHDRESLLSSLRRMRLLALRSRLWLLWRKGTSGGITQNVLRAVTNEVGLVDYKICSVDREWSAMLFALRKP